MKGAAKCSIVAGHSLDGAVARVSVVADAAFDGKIYVYRMDSFNVDVLDVEKETWSEESGPESRTKYLDFFFC